MERIIKELNDLTYLDWTRTRHSSGTAGSFLKSYEKIGGDKFYYKLSNFDVRDGIIGHECVNEIIAGRLLSVMGINHLEYELVHAQVLVRGVKYETYLCRSRDFKRKGESKIALDALYDMEHLPGENPMDFCIRAGWGNFIYEMLAFDFIILNRDRHGANIEILKNGRDRKFYPAPLFDHGLSMLLTSQLPDPLEDKRVQSFVGGGSALENLALIPGKKMPSFPGFDDQLKKIVFDGMDDIMGDGWVEAAWNFLRRRAEKYEDIRNKRQYDR